MDEKKKKTNSQCPVFIDASPSRKKKNVTLVREALGRTSEEPWPVILLSWLLSLSDRHFSKDRTLAMQAQ
jgi:hypothetical protein